MNETANLFKLIKEEKVADVLQLLSHQKKLDLSLVNEVGQSPLHLAVLSNQLEVAAVLLSKGYDPNLQDLNLLSPFIAAAANGLTEMFELLLQYDPEVTQVNRFGGTALLPSSEKGFITIVEKALAVGVPVNHINRLGWSALLEAVVLGNDGFLYRDIVGALMKHGAEPKVVDFEGNDAFTYARNLGHSLIESTLQQHTPESVFEPIKEFIRQAEFYRALTALLKLEESTEQFYYLGRVYEGLKQDTAAKFYYQKGFAKDPQFAYYLANLAKKAGDVEGALTYFNEGASFSGELDFYCYHKSNYLRELGRHEEAIQMMDYLLSRQPNRVDYLFHKANSLRSLERHQEAYEAMLQATLIQPNNQLFQEHLIHSQQIL